MNQIIANATPAQLVQLIQKPGPTMANAPVSFFYNQAVGGVTITEQSMFARGVIREFTLYNLAGKTVKIIEYPITWKLVKSMLEREFRGKGIVYGWEPGHLAQASWAEIAQAALIPFNDLYPGAVDQWLLGRWQKLGFLPSHGMAVSMAAKR